MRAQAYAQQGAALATQLAKPYEAAVCTAAIGGALMVQGLPNPAMPYLDKARDYFERNNHRADLAAVLLDLGLAHSRKGEYKLAMQRFEQALTISEALNDGNGRAAAINNLGLTHYYLSDFPQAEARFKQAQQLYTQTGNRQGLAIATGSMGLLNMGLANYDAAFAFYKQVLPLLDKPDDRPFRANFLSNLGIISRNMGDYQRALAFIIEAKKINEQLGNKRGLAVNLDEMGIISEFLDQQKPAEEYYRQSLALRQEIGDARGTANALESMALIAERTGRVDSAVALYKQSLNIRKQINNPMGITTSLHYLGRIQFQRNDFAGARAYFQEGVEISAKRGLNAQLADNLFGIADILKQQGNYMASKDSVMRMLQLCNTHTLVGKIPRAEKLLAEIYAKLGRHDSAYAHLMRSATIEDSIRNTDAVRRIATMERNAAIEKKQSEIEILSREKKLQDLTLQKSLQQMQLLQKQDTIRQLALDKQQALLAEQEIEALHKTQQVDLLQKENERRQAVAIGMGVALFLAALLAVLQYRAYRQKQHANNLLAAQKNEIEAKNHQVNNANHELHATLDNLRRTQKQLLEVEKMAALGQLMAGIAHEVASPLSAIKASAQFSNRIFDALLGESIAYLRTLPPEVAAQFAQLVRNGLQRPTLYTTKEERHRKQQLAEEVSAFMKPDADLLRDLWAAGVYADAGRYRALLERPDAAKLVHNAANWVQMGFSQQQIDQASEKTTRILTVLKSYSQLASEDRKVPVPLPQTIEVALQVHESLIKQGVQVERQYLYTDPVPVYINQVEQVWSNLVHNAILALTGQPERKITLRVARENGYVRVDVQDTGCGIPPENISQIFEPFFSTRPKGQGSGLGLDMCRKFVERHGGSLSVESRTGHTVFTTRLPIEASAEAGNGQPGTPAAATPVS